MLLVYTSEQAKARLASPDEYVVSPNPDSFNIVIQVGPPWRSRLLPPPLLPNACPEPGPELRDRGDPRPDRQRLPRTYSQTAKGTQLYDMSLFLSLSLSVCRRFTWYCHCLSTDVCATKVFDRVIDLTEGLRRWYDIPFTPLEALSAEKEFLLHAGPTYSSNAPLIDSLEVYGLPKDKFRWKVRTADSSMR